MASKKSGNRLRSTVSQSDLSPQASIRSSGGVMQQNNQQEDQLDSNSLLLGETVNPDLSSSSSAPASEASSSVMTGLDSSSISEGGEVYVPRAGDPMQNHHDQIIEKKQNGKKVKVYELQSEAWVDRGTGYAVGVYDDATDKAFIFVSGEEEGDAEEEVQQEESTPEGDQKDGMDVVAEESTTATASTSSHKESTAATAVSAEDDPTPPSSSTNMFLPSSTSVPVSEEPLPGGFIPATDSAAGLGLSLEPEPSPEDNLFPRGHRQIIKSWIQTKEVYQRQQDTLIVWTEPSGIDFALSFADPDDCENLWEFIRDVQKLFKSAGVGSDDDDSLMTGMHADGDEGGLLVPIPHGVGDDSYGDDSSQWPLRGSSSPTFTSASSPGRILNSGGNGSAKSSVVGEITLGRLVEIDKDIKQLARTNQGRERLVEAVSKEDLVKRLIVVLEEAEDLESIEDLHQLCSIMQTILFLNDTQVIDYLLTDDIFLGFVGILEYDPEFPTLKAAYREWLTTVARFREVIHIPDEGIRMKIVQTYRLLYLKDVVLARVLDDPTFNILNSFIFFNQNDIVTYAQQTDKLLLALFSPFQTTNTVSKNGSKAPIDDDAAPSTGWGIQPKQESTSTLIPDSKKAEYILFLHQLMVMAKSVQLPTRLSLYRTLLDRGILQAVIWAFGGSDRNESEPWSFGQKDVTISNSAAEILMLLLEHDPMMVRQMALKTADESGYSTADVEVKRKSPTLGDVVRIVMTEAEDTGLKGQMAEALRQMLDTGDSEPTTGFNRGPVKDGPIAQEFLNHFYDNSAHNLVKPFEEVPALSEESPSSFDLPAQQVATLQHHVDLLSFFVGNHGHLSQYFVLSTTLVVKIASLLTIRSKPLRHSAIRFFRACLKTKNHFMYRNLIKHRVFDPILELAGSESPRDNMLSSACLEMFDYIRRDNIKAVIDTMVANHTDKLRELADRPVLKNVFTGLMERWELNHQPPPRDESMTDEERKKRGWTSDRETDQEDDYFRDSDSDDGPMVGSSTPRQVPANAPLFPVSALSPSTSAIAGSNSSGGKRKRQRFGSQTKGMKLFSSQPLNKLVSLGQSFLGLDDYDDDPPSPSSSLNNETTTTPDNPDPPSPSAHKTGLSASPSSSRLSSLAGLASDSGGTGLGLAPSPMELDDSSRSLTLDDPEKLEGVALKMSEKRRREEEEEESGGLAGLLAGRKSGGKGKASSLTGSSNSTSTSTGSAVPPKKRPKSGGGFSIALGKGGTSSGQAKNGMSSSSAESKDGNKLKFSVKLSGLSSASAAPAPAPSSDDPLMTSGESSGGGVVAAGSETPETDKKAITTSSSQ